MQLKYALIAINILLVLILGIRAILAHFFSNTMAAPILVIILLLVGLLVGLFFARKNDKNLEDIVEKATLYLGVTVSMMLLSLVLGINLNYLLSVAKSRKELVQIVDIQPYIAARGGVMVGEKLTISGYKVLVLKDGKEETLRLSKLDNYESLIGQTIPFTFRKGLLGFDCFLPEK